MATCPTELELERFVEGVCPSEVRARIEVHREECATCGTWLSSAFEDEALLDGIRRAHSRSEAELDSAIPATPTDSEVLGILSDEPALARYRILRRLGAGGMGVVYEAEQQSPRRPVALKVLGAALVSERALRLFERESEILGRLSHPSIARILEAGTYTSHGEPRPFFAMELVKGRPLCEFAKRRDLDVRARVALVARICDAVQHAHQMGVVHRDLKPANVLVCEDGTPKVLDFGVARIFDPEAGPLTAHTQVPEVVGTLPYISPEQLAGDPLEVDTRTDVYALGVTLYELLAGRPPFRVGTGSVAEAIRVIEVQDPVLLGAVDVRLAGDLEVIAQKALEKDKDRRYESAAALAEDLRRHLRFEPIRARPPTALYHLGRFARRNRAVVAGLGLTFVALLAGLGATTWQARRARAAEASSMEQARRAEGAEAEARARAASVAETNTFFQALIGFDSDDPEGVTLSGATTLRELMSGAGEHLDGDPFSDPETEATLRIAIGNAQRRFGASAEAVETLQRALELRETNLGPDALLVAETLNTLGVALVAEEREEEALAAWERALEIYRAHGSPEPEMEATTLGNLAWTLVGEGRLTEAEGQLLDALAVHRELMGADSMHVANDLGHLADLRRVQGRPLEAIELLLESVDIARRTGNLGHTHSITSMARLSFLLVGEGRREEALDLVRERVEWTEQALGVHRETAGAHYDYSTLALVMRQDQDALEHAQRAVELFEELQPDGADLRGALNALGQAQLRVERLADGESTLTRALALFEAAGSGGESGHLATMNDLGLLWCRQGEVERGRALLAAGVDGLRAGTFTGGPNAVRAYDALAWATEQLDPDSLDLDELHRKALQHAQRLPLPRDAHWLVVGLAGHGRHLARTGRGAEAEPVLRRAWRVALEHDLRATPLADRVRTTLAAVLASLGRFGEAAALYLDELSQPTAEDRSPRHLELMQGVVTTMQYQGRLAEAQDWARASLDLAVELEGQDSILAAEAHGLLASVLVDEGQLDLALAEFELAAEVLGAAPPAHAAAARVQASHGNCLALLGRHAAAEPLLLGACEALRTQVQDTHPAARRALDATAQLYESWGRPDQAAPFRARAEAR